MNIFFKEGITTEQQVKINMDIRDMVNHKDSDYDMVCYLENKYNFTKEEAKKELNKAKLFMGWYARKD